MLAGGADWDGWGIGWPGWLAGLAGWIGWLLVGLLVGLAGWLVPPKATPQKQMRNPTVWIMVGIKEAKLRRF